jgi:hypothetical protein
MYISDFANSCILKINSNNTISNFIGQCGTADSVDGYGTSDNTTNPTRVRYPGQMVIDPENPSNFFYTEGFNQGTGKIHYANTTSSNINIRGISAAGKSTYDVKTTTIWSLIAPSGTTSSFNGIAAYKNKWVCVSSGGIMWSTWSTYLDGGGNYMNAGAHAVYCYDRANLAGEARRIVGADFSTPVRAGSSLGFEHELLDGINVPLHQPQGLAFDEDGNLYISERGSHVIKMVRRWWP